MPPLRTTLGQLLINEALPEKHRNYDRVLDKKGMQALLRDIAEQSPEQYKEVSKKLADIGRHVATRSGGNSFSLEHMLKAKAAHKISEGLQAEINKILNDDRLTDQQRHELIVRKTGAAQEQQMKEVYAESLAEGNPLAKQVQSGSRGNEMNLASLRGSDMLYTDHHDNVIPLPVLRSYSQGLTPAEYWAGTYGARKGVMATKFATQDAGFLSKQLNQVSHRLMVSDLDHEHEYPQNRGLPVSVDDMDNEGSLLAHDVGPYKRHTMLTPKILKHMKALGHDRILVRSTLVGGSPDGGVYSRDVGVRERGGLPGRGEQIGLQAAQALSEPLQQGQLSAKHSGGVAGQEKAVSGFDAVNQLIQAPKTFKGGAAHATIDGTVQRVEDAPAGGSYVTIDGQQHYVGRGYDLKVKPGDRVEAGDTISEGWPNPATVIEHKGIGEGRRYFVEAMRDAMKGAGLKVNRRNLEVLSRGLINHVRLTEEHGDHVPDDVISYSTLEHTYEPREGHQVLAPKHALGQYLEKPILHYTIGTKVRPSMLKDFEHFGVNDVTVHKEPPPFQAEMIRGMANVAHDPDWMTRMYGSGQKASLLEAAQRGGTSNELGTSFVPGLARAVDFGRVGMVRQPEPTSKPDVTGPSMPRPSAKTEPSPAPAPAPKKAKSWSGLLKWSEDKKARLTKKAQSPATPGVPGTTKSPEQPKPPPAPQVSPPASTSNPAPPAAPAPAPAPAPSNDYVGGTGSAATTTGIQQKIQQNGPMVYNGGFRPGQNYLTGMDPSQAGQYLQQGGLDALGAGLDQNAWAVLTGQARGHNMQFNGMVPGYGGMGRYGMGGFGPGGFGPGMGPFGDGDDEDFSYYGGGGDGEAHPGGGVQPSNRVPGIGWNDAAKAFTQYAAPGAMVAGLGSHGVGWGARALGGFGLFGDNRITRIGKGFNAVGSGIGKLITPLQVVLGTGEDVGMAFKGDWEGMRHRNATTLHDTAGLLDIDKWRGDGWQDQVMPALNLLNPVTHARNIGTGSVEIGRNVVGGFDAAVNPEQFQDMSRLEADTDVGRHFEAQDKIRRMTHEAARQRAEQGQWGINPTAHVTPKYNPLGPNDSAKDILNALVDPVGMVSDTHTMFSTLKGQAGGQAQTAEQRVREMQAQNQAAVAGIRARMQAGQPVSDQERQQVAYVDAQEKKTDAQKVIEKANLGTVDAATYMMTSKPVATPGQILRGESNNPLTGKPLTVTQIGEDAQQAAKNLEEATRKKLEEAKATAARLDAEAKALQQRLADEAAAAILKAQEDAKRPVATKEEYLSGNAQIPGTDLNLPSLRPSVAKQQFNNMLSNWGLR